MVNFDVRGIVPPVFTPMYEDGTINYEMINHYANYLKHNGIKAILVGGTTGEHMALSKSDREKIINAWLDVSISYKFHIQVQVGGAPLPNVLDLARFCQKRGVNSIMTLPELYFKPATVDDLVYYVSQIAEAAPDLPVLYYHIPFMSGVNINMREFVIKATECIPNFKGLKFTSNDLSEAAQVHRVLKEDQVLFLGAETLLAPAALLGITSSIGTSFNLFPKLAESILTAVSNNDLQKARELQEKLTAAVEAHTCAGPWVPAFKAGMWIVTGIDVGPPARPLTPISDESKNKLETKLKDLELA